MKRRFYSFLIFAGLAFLPLRHAEAAILVEWQKNASIGHSYRSQTPADFLYSTFPYSPALAPPGFSANLRSDTQLRLSIAAPTGYRWKAAPTGNNAFLTFGFYFGVGSDYFGPGFENLDGATAVAVDSAAGSNTAFTFTDAQLRPSDPMFYFNARIALPQNSTLFFDEVTLDLDYGSMVASLPEGTLPLTFAFGMLGMQQAGPQPVDPGQELTLEAVAVPEPSVPLLLLAAGLLLGAGKIRKQIKEFHPSSHRA